MCVHVTTFGIKGKFTYVNMRDKICVYLQTHMQMSSFYFFFFFFQGRVLLCTSGWDYRHALPGNARNPSSFIGWCLLLSMVSSLAQFSPIRFHIWVFRNKLAILFHSYWFQRKREYRSSFSLVEGVGGRGLVQNSFHTHLRMCYGSHNAMPRGKKKYKKGIDFISQWPPRKTIFAGILHWRTSYF